MKNRFRISQYFPHSTLNRNLFWLQFLILHYKNSCGKIVLRIIHSFINSGVCGGKVGSGIVLQARWGMWW